MGRSRKVTNLLRNLPLMSCGKVHSTRWAWDCARKQIGQVYCFGTANKQAKKQTNKHTQTKKNTDKQKKHTHTQTKTNTHTHTETHTHTRRDAHTHKTVAFRFEKHFRKLEPETQALSSALHTRDGNPAVQSTIGSPKKEETPT